MNPIWLNASAFSDLHSLFISFTFLLILSQDHLNKILFQALVNSGPTHCFVDLKFVDNYYLKMSVTLPVALHLFDSSLNKIFKIANLSIILPTGDFMNLNFYITPLDSSCSLVLRYNWFTQHNSLIDWINWSINFYLFLQKNLVPSCIIANIPLASPLSPDISLQSSDSVVSIPISETSMSISEQFNIAIISVAVFIYTSKLPGSSKFQLYLCSSDIQANSAKLAEASDLSNFSPKYHEFSNVFSKTKAEVFTSHHSYDL